MPTLTIVIASSVRLMSETGKLKVHMNTQAQPLHTIPDLQVARRVEHEASPRLPVSNDTVRL